VLWQSHSSEAGRCHPPKGTQGWDINSEGTIVGYFYDSNYGVHGFLRIPH